MQIDNDKETAPSENLFKAYQLLQPSSKCGKENRYRKYVIISLWLMFEILCMNFVRLWLSFADLSLFQYNLMEFSNLTLNTLKGYVVIMNADKLSKVMEAARYGFTWCGRQNPSRLHRCGYSLGIWLCTFTILIVGTMIIWILSPWFAHEYEEFAELDGTVGNHRPFVFNLWYPVTEAMYNRLPIWAMIYMYEIFMVNLVVISVLFFDSFLITMCVMLVGQFETLAAAYESLGEQRHHVLPFSQSPGRKIEKQHVQSDHYNHLIFLLKDNEKIMKKYDDFLDIIRPAILVQVFVSSVSMISMILSILLNIQSGLSIISIQILKYMSTYVLSTVQLYIYCNFLNILENAKSTLNFGLYSSNWTEMDLKFKKTMLLKMIINSAHKRVIKASPEIIINLQLFVRVMKISYTVVSVLLNLSKKNTTTI